MLRDIGAETICAFLAETPRVKSVAIRNAELEEPQLGTLLELATLEELSLSSNRLGDKFMKMTASRFTKLRALALDRNCIGPDGVSFIQLGELEELSIGTHLGGNPIGDIGAKRIAEKLPGKLLILRLDNCIIGAAGAKSIAKALPKSELNLLGMDKNPIGDEGGKALGDVLEQCQKLEQLSLTLCSLTDEAAYPLGAACPTWMRLIIINNTLSPLCRKILLESGRIS